MVTTTRYIYDGNQYLAEADETDTITRLYTNEPDAYTHLISQEEISTGETLTYHYDALGSTRTVTDNTETVTDEFTYDAWGNRLSRTGTNDIPFQYVGQYGYYREDTTDSHYVMARTYQPSIARWLSEDPLGYINGVNLYLYGNNCVFLYIDPSGERCTALPPPDRVIPPEDPYFPTPRWEPFPKRGYNTSIGPNGSLCASFSAIQCDYPEECCTFDLEVCARSYRYYRTSEGRIIDHRGKTTRVSNDPRDFFSLVVLTVCMTNISCDGVNMPDEKDSVLVGPLQKEGRGVFIRDIGGIEPTAKSFEHKDPCMYAEELDEWLERHTVPGRIDSSPR